MRVGIMDYDNLNDALADIAQRSFYESATVSRNPATGRYVVEDDYPGTDSVMWTYDDGMELPSGVADNSMVHEPCEFYSTAEHIRYNVGRAVELIESGHVIGFEYVIVDAYPDDDEFAEGDDTTVGWALIAHDYGEVD